MSTETLNMKGLLWQWAPRTKHGSRCTFEVRTQGLFDLFVFSISFEVGTRVLWCWLEDFLPATFGNGHVSDMVVRSLTTASVDLYSWVSCDPASMAANTIAANSLGFRTKKRAAPGIERTSRTRSENHTTRPSSRWVLSTCAASSKFPMIRTNSHGKANVAARS